MDSSFTYLPVRNLKDRIDGAEYLLKNLFIPSPYPHEVQTIFSSVSPTAMEDFFYYETLISNTVLKLSMKFPDDFSMPEELPEQSQRILRWLRENQDKGTAAYSYSVLIILYFLHTMHNKKLDRCLESMYNLKEPDPFLSKCLVSASESQNTAAYQTLASAYSLLFPELGTRRETIRSAIADSLFPIVSHSSFTYVLKEDLPIYGTETLDSHVSGTPLADFRIRIQYFDDDKYDGSEGHDFADYVDYLLRKDRNGIGDFNSSLRAFWKEVVGTSRAQTIINLRPSDTDLARFCIALGLDKLVYQRLQMLRENYAPFQEAQNDGKKKGVGVLTKKKSHMINIFLNQASPRLMEARNICGQDTKRIPRQMLVNASIQLLMEDVSGLTKVTEEELRAYMVKEELVQTLLARQNNRRE